MTNTWVTKAQACEQFNVHLNTIKKLIANGELQTIKIGRSVRISQASIDEFIQRKTGE